MVLSYFLTKYIIMVAQTLASQIFQHIITNILQQTDDGEFETALNHCGFTTHFDIMGMTLQHVDELVYLDSST